MSSVCSQEKKGVWSNLHVDLNVDRRLRKDDVLSFGGRGLFIIKKEPKTYSSEIPQDLIE